MFVNPFAEWYHLMKKQNKYPDKITSELKQKAVKPSDSAHLGSPNAFEETENPSSKDPDNISDEMLDELLDEWILFQFLEKQEG